VLEFRRRARSSSKSALKGELALQRSGRSLFQIAVESALDIDLQEARQQSLSRHFLKGLGVTLVVLLGQDDDAPKIERLLWCISWRERY
jgi:hypothetical protein